MFNYELFQIAYSVLIPELYNDTFQGFEYDELLDQIASKAEEQGLFYDMDNYRQALDQTLNIIEHAHFEQDLDEDIWEDVDVPGQLLQQIPQMPEQMDPKLNKFGSILDKPQKKLDPKIFRNETPKRQVIDFVEQKILNALEKYFGFDVSPFIHLFLTGSLTTYQYRPTSDMDISIFVDYYEWPTYIEDVSKFHWNLVTLVINQFDGIYVPGTRHPLQIFVQGPDVNPGQLFQYNVRSAWSFDEKRWLVPPSKDTKDVDKEIPGVLIRAHKLAEKMTIALETNPDSAIQLYRQIHKKRQNATKYGDLNEDNIVYKFLDMAGLFDRLRGLGIRIAGEESIMYERIPYLMSRDGRIVVALNWDQHHYDLWQQNDDALALGDFYNLFQGHIMLKIDTLNKILLDMNILPPYDEAASGELVKIPITPEQDQSVRQQINELMNYYGIIALSHKVSSEDFPAPGTIPIPPDYIRLYHYTNVPLEVIEQEGLRLDKAKGETYGEPNAIWASTRMPNPEVNFVEFAVPYNDPRIAIGKYQEGINYGEGGKTPEAYTKWLYDHESSMTFYGDIRPEEIIGYHQPWKSHVRYINENFANEDLDQFNWVYDNPAFGDYQKAIDYLRKNSAAQAWGIWQYPFAVEAYMTQKREEDSDEEAYNNAYMVLIEHYGLDELKSQQIAAEIHKEYITGEMNVQNPFEDDATINDMWPDTISKKTTKAWETQHNYRRGETGRECDDCAFFKNDAFCTRFRSRVESDYVCDEFIKPSSAIRQSKEETYQISYSFDNDEITLSPYGKEASADDDIKIVGEYDGENAILYPEADDWFNPDYFKKLWVHSFHDKPLKEIYLEWDGELHHIDTRPYRRRRTIKSVWEPKTSAWDDVMDKARRYLSEGRVNVTNNDWIYDDQSKQWWNYSRSDTDGDTGQYETEIYRQDPNSLSISTWHCNCPWGQVSWGRTRGYKRYEGRPCAHTLALQWSTFGQRPSAPPNGPTPPKTEEPQPQIPGSANSLMSETPETLEEEPNVESPQPTVSQPLTPDNSPFGIGGLSHVKPKISVSIAPPQFDFDNPTFLDDEPNESQGWRAYVSSTIYENNPEAWLEILEHWWNGYKGPIIENVSWEEAHKFLLTRCGGNGPCNQIANWPPNTELYLENTYDPPLSRNKNWWVIEKMEENKFSKTAAVFKNGDIVRIKPGNSLMGVDRDGNYHLINESTSGEVLYCDDKDCVVIFSLKGYQLTPAIVKVETSPQTLYKDRGGKPFTSKTASISFWVSKPDGAPFNENIPFDQWAWETHNVYVDNSIGAFNNWEDEIWDLWNQYEALNNDPTFNLSNSNAIAFLEYLGLTPDYSGSYDPNMLKTLIQQRLQEGGDDTGTSDISWREGDPDNPGATHIEFGRRPGYFEEYMKALLNLCEIAIPINGGISFG